MFQRVLPWVARLVLAAIFLYAGFSKVYPPENRFRFEITLSTQQLLPDWGVIAVARVLPWLEIALGVLLIAGWKLRYVATFATLLLGTFLTAVSITYARGIQADCGCFGFGEPISRWTLTRDTVFLALAGYLAVSAWRASRVRASGAPPS